MESVDDITAEDTAPSPMIATGVGVRYLIAKGRMRLASFLCAGSGKP